METSPGREKVLTEPENYAAYVKKLEDSYRKAESSVLGGQSHAEAVATRLQTIRTHLGRKEGQQPVDRTVVIKDGQSESVKATQTALSAFVQRQLGGGAAPAA